MLQSPTADPSAYVTNKGKIERLNRGSRMAVKAPADLIRHPVSDSGENRLVQEECLDRSPLSAGSYLPEIIQRKPVVEHFHREALPGVVTG